MVEKLKLKAERQKDVRTGRCLSSTVLGLEIFQCEKEFNHSGKHTIKMELEWS